MAFIFTKAQRIAAAAALAVVALVAVVLLTAPPRDIDPERRLNMMVVDGDSVMAPPLRAWLLNAVMREQAIVWWNEWEAPDDDGDLDAMSGHVAQRYAGLQPVYVRQPLQPDSAMTYPLVIMPQGEHGNLYIDQHDQDWLDECIVVTPGARDTSGVYTAADVADIERRILPALSRMGYRFDPRFVTVLDDSDDGSLAVAVATSASGAFRNIVWCGSPAPVSIPATPSRHVLVGTRDDYSEAYEAWSDAGVECDLIAAEGDSASHVAVLDLLNGLRGVATSRLDHARRRARELGCDERYVMFVDYTLPSGKNRFFIYDYRDRRIVVCSKCAHGCGPGNTEAVPHFSNQPGSQCSSLGDYIVGAVHPMFKNGRIAIELNGVDSTNNNAALRGIKIHGGMRMEGEIYPDYLPLGKLSEGCVALSNIPFALTCGIVNATSRPILLQAYY